MGGAEVHLLRQRVCTDVKNAGSQQTGWKLQARPEKALLSTVQADASCAPHSNPGLGSHFLYFFNWKNWLLIKLSLSLTSLAAAIWQSLTHNLNELFAFLRLFFLTYIKISGSPW